MPTDVTPAQFRGALIGLAVGDALGAPWEGLTADVILRQGGAASIVEHATGATLHYTDDTQMMIGVAENLLAHGAIEQETLVATFIEHFDRQRGYGPGTTKLLEIVAAGGNHAKWSRAVFPGGSFGNGAAMPVAPVGVAFANDLDAVAREAMRSAEVTHAHPLGVDGARVLALAVAQAAKSGRDGAPLDRREFLDDLAQRAETEEFGWQLTTARDLGPHDSLAAFGNSSEAHRSVVTAILCFARHPDDYAMTVQSALGQGNDVDTLAAMAGALSGARLGDDAIPIRLTECLENGEAGRDDILALADRLGERFTR